MGAIGRTLAEFGADVVRIEPPGGAPDRVDRIGYTSANLGKRGAALALSDPRLEALTTFADILIETARPGSTDAEILADLRARRPTLVILSARDFGEGPLESWQATDLVLQALNGVLSRSGEPGRPPLPPPGELAFACAAAQGVYGLLVAWLNRLITGKGDHLELSLLDATVQALDPGYGAAGSAALGAAASDVPRGRPDSSHLYPILPCKDGHVRLTVLAARQWQGMLDWMGRPAELSDPALNNIQARFASTTLLPAIARFFADKTRAEIEQESEAHHVPAAGVLTLAEAMASAQIRARDVFRQVDLAPGVSAPFPNGVVEIDGARAGANWATPPADADADKVITDWARPRAPHATPSFGAPGRPLAGLRVLDLGVIIVGSEHGKLLADYGAEVIKIETTDFPDAMRTNAQTFPRGMSPTFAAGQRNRLSLGLGLRSPEGRELFLRLAAVSDVVLTNFKPGTLESLDLGPEALLAINPALIVVESSAFGGTGPWRGRLGYGPLVRASAGLTHLWSYPGEVAGFSDHVTVYPDHVAGRVGVSAAMALLIRRARTGRGGLVGVSQTEVMLSHLAADIAAQSVGEPRPDRAGPWGVFRCAGDDEWCVVTVRDANDGRALAGVLERSDLPDSSALQNWLAGRDPHAASATLQAAGVPAAPMLRVSELPAYPHFAARGVFQSLEHPDLEAPQLVDNSPIRSERLQRPPLAPAPHLGEHTRRIARERLSLSDAEIDRLLAANILQAPPGA